MNLPVILAVREVVFVSWDEGAGIIYTRNRNLVSVRLLCDI